ncbi:MAG: succinylglutamate desuccinylase/aspartoacylase family protein [Sphaerochaetaceae bacterium]|nr:succinylglutamate desuccinylase/aspartoacylase family protein [Sphaerochaetaceae bacterium]
MKRLATLLILVLLLTGCNKKASVEPSVVPEPTVASEPEVVNEVANDVPDGYRTVYISGTPVLVDDYKAYEPDSYLDIYNMSLEDFGSFFETKYEVEDSVYTIMEGTISETQVYHIHSKNEGPTVYVVGAVHGDERAAWYASLMLREATISCGDLYVLVPANASGAKNVRRYVTGNQDLNRSFPGDEDGNEAERLAFAIFNDVADKCPDIVLDLHEAIVYTANRDFLGSTYIFTKLDNMDELFFDLVFATQDGTICHNEFSVTGPGPAGSINCEVTNLLRIPVITVETFRGFDIFRRVQDQLDSVEFVVDYLGMR